MSETVARHMLNRLADLAGCGEQALLPAVRSASDETVVVADGFSCKTQIEQAGTGRRAAGGARMLRR